MSEENPCANYLAVCKAACCRLLVIDVKEGEMYKPGILKVRINNPKMIKYLEYHGCKYRAGVIYVPLEEGKYKIVEQKLHLMRDCSMLDENYQCKINENKPFVCKDFDNTTKHIYHVPKGCKYYEKN